MSEKLGPQKKKEAANKTRDKKADKKQSRHEKFTPADFQALKNEFEDYVLTHGDVASMYQQSVATELANIYYSDTDPRKDELRKACTWTAKTTKFEVKNGFKKFVEKVYKELFADKAEDLKIEKEHLTLENAEIRELNKLLQEAEVVLSEQREIKARFTAGIDTTDNAQDYHNATMDYARAATNLESKKQLLSLREEGIFFHDKRDEELALLNSRVEELTKDKENKSMKDPENLPADIELTPFGKADKEYQEYWKSKVDILKERYKDNNIADKDLDYFMVEIEVLLKNVIEKKKEAKEISDKEVGQNILGGFSLLYSNYANLEKDLHILTKKILSKIEEGFSTEISSSFTNELEDSDIINRIESSVLPESKKKQLLIDLELELGSRSGLFQLPVEEAPVVNENQEIMELYEITTPILEVLDKKNLGFKDIKVTELNGGINIHVELADGTIRDILVSRAELQKQFERKILNTKVVGRYLVVEFEKETPSPVAEPENAPFDIRTLNLVKGTKLEGEDYFYEVIEVTKAGGLKVERTDKIDGSKTITTYGKNRVAEYFTKGKLLIVATETNGLDIEKPEEIATLEEKIAQNGTALVREEVFLRKLEMEDSNTEEELKKAEQALANLESGDKVQGFSKDFIRDQIKNLLDENNALAEDIDVGISNGRIVVNISGIVAEGTKVKRIELELQNNKKGELEYRDFTTHDGFIVKGIVAGFLGPKIRNAAETLKSYIQKKDGREVQRIWIEDDELKVQFDTSKVSDETIKERADLIPLRQKLIAEREISQRSIETQKNIIRDLEWRKAELEKQLLGLTSGIPDVKEPQIAPTELTPEKKAELLQLLQKAKEEFAELQQRMNERNENIRLRTERINFLRAAEASGIAHKENQEAVKDDLTKIPGISPVNQEMLNENGIQTYEQLAETSVARLREIIDNHTGPVWTFGGDMKDWPEHARLAAQGTFQEESEDDLQIVLPSELRESTQPLTENQKRAKTLYERMKPRLATAGEVITSPEMMVLAGFLYNDDQAPFTDDDLTFSALTTNWTASDFISTGKDTGYQISNNSLDGDRMRFLVKLAEEMAELDIVKREPIQLIPLIDTDHKQPQSSLEGDLNLESSYNIQSLMRNFKGQQFANTSGNMIYGPNPTGGNGERVRIVPTENPAEFLILPTNNPHTLEEIVSGMDAAKDEALLMNNGAPKNIQDPAWLIVPGIAVKEGDYFKITKKMTWSW